MLLILSGGMRVSIRQRSTIGSRGLLPDAPGTVLDIGAGSGRDAAWFSAQGYDVIAVEPSSGMRSRGATRAPRASHPLDRRPASRSDHSRPDGDQFRSRDADRCLETRAAISARPGLPQDRSAGQVRGIPKSPSNRVKTRREGFQRPLRRGRIRHGTPSRSRSFSAAPSPGGG